MCSLIHGPYRSRRWGGQINKQIGAAMLSSTKEVYIGRDGSTHTHTHKACD